MNDRSLLVGSWAVAIVLVTAVSFKQTQALPQPSRIIKTCAVWTILGVISEANAQLAGVMGLGLLVPLTFVLVNNDPKASINVAGLNSAEGNIATAALGASAVV